MAEYTIVVKVDPSGVTAGRAKVSQELAGIEADARRTGAAGEAGLNRLSTASTKAGAAATAMGAGTKGAAAEAAALAAAAQASARGTSALTAGLTAQTSAARLNTIAMRETLVVARELARGNFTRLPGSLSLLSQGVASQGGIGASVTALANMLGILKTTQNAELSLAATDAATAAAAIRGAAERAAANIIAADTELELAHSAVVVSTSAETEAVAQARLAAAHEAVAAAAAEAAIAEDAVAVSEARAGEAALAAAAESATSLNPVAIVIGLVAVAATGLYFAFRNVEDAAHKAADKLEENAKKADIDRQAHEIFAHTLLGVEDALRKNHDAIEKANEANKTSAEIALQNAALDQVRLGNIYKETEANLELAKSRLRVALADPNRGTNLGTAAQAQADQTQQQVDQLTADIAKAKGDAIGAANDYTTALANYAADAGKRDTADIIKRRYEGPGGLIDEATKAALAASSAAKAAGNEALAHRLITTELTKQVELIHAKEKAELAAAAQAERDAKRQGEILALPISGGRITTKFGQMESGVGVGPHAHQGVDIATPVGTPVYARSGGTVDFARQMSGYGNVIQINFGGGVTARYGHLEKFNVKPGDVVNAGDVIGLSGGARGAAGAGDSTGPHLHYEERVGNRAVNPLTTKVQVDAEGAQTAGYKKAEEAAQAAAKKAEAEKDFVERTIDAANETALPKIDALAAKIKKTMDDYRHQFKEAMKPADAASVTKALTDADAREVAEHFQKAYVDPLKPLQDGLGKTAVQQSILNAEQKEATDRGVKELLPAQKAIIENYYQQEDVLKREDAILKNIRQPVEDYTNQLKALNKLLAEGSINQTTFNARVADLNGPLRQALANAPDGAGQRGGINVTDPNAGGKTSNFQTFTDAAAAAEENARYSDELKVYSQFRDQFLKMGIDFDALEEAAHRRHVDNLNDIDMARRQMQLSAGQSIADSLASIAESVAGKQSAVYRSLFAISKAFTIAQASLALYQNVAKAMSIGFPQNLPFIAAAFAQGATIVSAIQSVVSPGFSAGGYTGDVGRNQPAGTVHGQEFVVNADATSRNRALLEAINSGRLTAQGSSIANDNPTSHRPMMVRVENYAPGVEYETRQGASVDEVVVIARKVAREEAPGAVAADMSRPNSKTSKAVTHHFDAPRKRA